ncbi:hypothetical protein UCREL1_5395 [Eutypa lata UCREL1]|uniref:Uncharacterized protein n=1 Tax=Eutypa lata (strain UCR-EL1) TaxID=1287681 RepID=M7ST13_EUTLA|nr:hypothetical protein UCREL1_5395 [Eutypa lata UCREL1]
MVVKTGEEDEAGGFTKEMVALEVVEAEETEYEGEEDPVASTLLVEEIDSLGVTVMVMVLDEYPVEEVDTSTLLEEVFNHWALLLLLRVDDKVAPVLNETDEVTVEDSVGADDATLEVVPFGETLLMEETLDEVVEAEELLVGSMIVMTGNPEDKVEEAVEEVPLIDEEVTVALVLLADADPVVVFAKKELVTLRELLEAEAVSLTVAEEEVPLTGEAEEEVTMTSVLLTVEDPVVELAKKELVVTMLDSLEEVVIALAVELAVEEELLYVEGNPDTEEEVAVAGPQMVVM